MIRIFVGSFLAAVFIGGLGIVALAAGGSRSLNAYLILASLLFAIGMFGFLARRNAISMLMSIELMLNAVNLSIVAFGGVVKGLGASGSVIALMVMAGAPPPWSPPVGRVFAQLLAKEKPRRYA